MSKFLLLYVGDATDMQDMSEEQQKGVMAAWEKWMGDVGSALVDVGTPTANGEAVVDDGSSRDALAITGYSIIEAADMASAKELVKDHPFLSDGNGNYAVEVFEMLPVPM